jgi:hypothetical protein
MLEGRKYFAYSNIKQSMLAIIEAMPDLGITFEDNSLLVGFQKRHDFNKF